MNIHEHQAKAVLAEFGVPVPRGQPAFTIDEAVTGAWRLNTDLYVALSSMDAQVANVLLVLAFPEAPWMFYVAYFVAGVGFEPFNIYWQTALQREIPGDRLARVSSLGRVGCSGGESVAAGGGAPAGAE